MRNIAFCKKMQSFWIVKFRRKLHYNSERNYWFLRNTSGRISQNPAHSQFYGNRPGDCWTNLLTKLLFVGWYIVKYRNLYILVFHRRPRWRKEPLGYRYTYSYFTRVDYKYIIWTPGEKWKIKLNKIVLEYAWPKGNT